MWAASQVLGTVGWGNRGLSGLEYMYNRRCAGRTACEGRQRCDRAADLDRRRPPRPGPGSRPADDRRRPPGRGRAGAGRRGRPILAQGLDRDRDGSEHGRILALANWPQDQRQRPERGAVVRKRGPGRRLQLRAGIDVQGVHRRGRAPGWPCHSGDGIRDPSVLQVADRQIHDAESHGDETLSVAQILKVSSNIGADEIGAEARAPAVRLLGPPLRLRRRRPGSTCPASSRASSCTGGSTRARRWATFRSGRASRSPRSRWPPRTRRSPTAGSCARHGSSSRSAGSRVPEPRGHRIISASTAAELRDMLRGVLADGGTASGAAIPGWDLAGKTGTANGCQRPVLEHRLRGLVHRLRPARVIRACSWR